MKRPRTDAVSSGRNRCTLRGISVDQNVAPGTGGIVPSLCAYGRTGAGDLATIALVDAFPSAPVLLVVAPQANPTPYVGGFLVPVPIQLVVPLATDANGQLVFPAPGATDPPIDVVLQYVVGDPGASFGQSLSNALTLTLGL